MKTATLTKKTLGTAAIAATLSLALANSASAVTFFGGRDSGVNSTGPRPSSNAAASNFDAAAGALGGINLLTFESLPTGNMASPTNLPGLSITQTGGAPNAISTDNDNILGFNTTAGGSKFLQTQTNATTTFTFATPIQAFGSYVTGLGTASGEALLQFNDGTSQSFNLTALLGTGDGGVGFFGFTDVGKSIASVSFVSATGTGGDVYGIDDVRFVSIPTPALLPGLVGISLNLWRKRKAKAA
jgi:hypothetical protein